VEGNDPGEFGALGVLAWLRAVQGTIPGEFARVARISLSSAEVDAVGLQITRRDTSAGPGA
jgi:hypothetical protein